MGESTVEDNRAALAVSPGRFRFIVYDTVIQYAVQHNTSYKYSTILATSTGTEHYSLRVLASIRTLLQ